MTPKEKAIEYLETKRRVRYVCRSVMYYSKTSICKALDIALKEQAIEYDFIIRELKKQFKLKGSKETK